MDAPLVRRLVAEQFPRWAMLPVEPFEGIGTVNTLWRLGDDLLVRVPRRRAWAHAVAHEQAWLPRLGRALPTRVPEPVAHGRPGCGYPCPWSVVRLIEGRPLEPGEAGERLAHDLAAVVRALREFDVTDAPAAFRTTLGSRDPDVRRSVAELGDSIDGSAALACWERSLSVPECAPDDRRWIHSDLIPANVLVRGDALAAVIDWNGSGLGDPAVDLVAAWALFDEQGRRTYRAAVAPTADEWERGRGWALSQGVIALPYYRDSNPVMASFARYVIAAVLANAS